MAIRRVGIIVGGGPAPGANGVIAAAAIEAIKRGVTAIGFRDGFEWLAQRYTDEQYQLLYDEVSRIYLHGGVVLGTSRADITRDAQSLANTVAALEKLGIEALITIGGDDLIASSIAVEKQSEGRIKVVQVPKSIDNDLWMPAPIDTLGFETARHHGVKIVENLMEDAKTTDRWYIGVTMGRPTGHLTLGIGKAASATCTLIPEEFAGNQISVADIAEIVDGSIVKRRAMGRSYGIALLSEALSERFSPEEVTELQDVGRDAQGNIRVADIDLGRKVKSEVQTRLESRGIKVTVVDKTIGYELRCAPPIPLDAEYARDLGYAAMNHLLEGGSGALITIQAGQFKPIPLSEVVDPVTGRGRQRPVDVLTESYQIARDYMVRLEPRDFGDDAWVDKLATAAELTPAEFRAQFGRLAR
jgi:6-phosphofructokinase 1